MAKKLSQFGIIDAIDITTYIPVLTGSILENKKILASDLLRGSTSLENDLTGATIGNALDATQGTILKGLITGLTSTVMNNYNLLTGETFNRIAQDNILDSLITGSTYTNTTPTPVTIGGISSGSVFSGLTTSQMFDELLYPELFPTLVNPSSTFTASLNQYYEVGSNISSITFNSTFSRGSISPSYGTDGFRSGLPTEYNYTGTGLTNTTTQSTSDSKTISNYVVINGVQSWTGSISYSSGQQPISSKGNNYNAPLTSGTTSTITKSLTGIYPFLFGMSSSILNGSTLYDTFGSTKLLETQGNKTILLNGTLEYIYFMFPSSYGNLVSIIDQNGFNVTGSFYNQTVSLNSTGLSSNYTINYNVYRTTDVTSVSSGNYQFKFN
jgi:hypothetical protein